MAAPTDYTFLASDFDLYCQMTGQTQAEAQTVVDQANLAAKAAKTRLALAKLLGLI